MIKSQFLFSRICLGVELLRSGQRYSERIKENTMKTSAGQVRFRKPAIGFARSFCALRQPVSVTVRRGAFFFAENWCDGEERG